MRTLNGKWKLALAVAAFALLIAGAGILYDQLSEGRTPAGADFLTDGTEEADETRAAAATTAANATTDGSEVNPPEEQDATGQASAASGDSGAEGGDGASETEEIMAPDFTVYDADGAAVKFSDLLAIGKPIVLNFWASWCPPCKSEMPHFNEVYLEKGEEVTFLMVDMTDGQRETKERAQEYVAGEDFSFPILFDMDSDAASVYGISSIPTTVFIHADGTILGGIEGGMDKATLESAVARLLE